MQLGMGFGLNFAGIGGKGSGVGPPPDFVWPNAGNTGTRSPPETPVTGDVNSSADGQVISGLAITNGTITITHQNVTVEDNEIDTTGTYCVIVQPGATGAVVRYNTLSGAQTGIQGFGDFHHNDISGVENGIVIANGNGWNVNYNYIHDLFAASDPHYDGIAAQGACSNGLIEDNWVYGGGAAIQGIFITDEGGATDDIIVRHNNVGNTTYNIIVGGALLTNMVVENNILDLGVSGFYNFNTTPPEELTVSGNISTRGQYIDGDAVPTEGDVAFTPSAVMSGSDLNNNFGFRVACTLAEVGTEYRIVFKAGSAGTDLRGMAVGKQSTGADSALALQELEFGDVTLVTEAIELTANVELVSDWFTPPASFNVSDVMLVGFSMENPGGTALASGNANATSYFGSTGGYDDASPAGYSESANNVFGIKRIECR